MRSADAYLPLVLCDELGPLSHFDSLHEDSFTDHFARERELHVLLHLGVDAHHYIGLALRIDRGVSSTNSSIFRLGPAFAILTVPRRRCARPEWSGEVSANYGSECKREREK